MDDEEWSKFEQRVRDGISGLSRERRRSILQGSGYCVTKCGDGSWGAIGDHGFVSGGFSTLEAAENALLQSIGLFD